MKDNVVWSFFLKAIGVGLSFVVLPLTINYLTVVEYGVWVTLFTIMNWVNILDLGIGLGMRNKLAAAVAQNDIDGIKKSISTGIISLILIGGCLIVIFVVIAQFVQFQVIFNTKEIIEEELYRSSILAGIFVIVSFSLSTINHMYFAYQKSAVTGIISITSSIILLLFLIILKMTDYHGIIYFVIAFGCSMIIAKVIFFIIFFYKRKDIVPSWRFFSKEMLKKITNVGVRFFIIQLCGVFSLLMTNMLITQLVGPEYVRTYDVVFKVLNFVVIVQNLVLSPLWSAYTAAYAQRDYVWMKRVYYKTYIMIIPLLLMLFLAANYIDTIIYIWMNININASTMLVVYMVLYNVLSLITENSCALLNGIGKLDLQVIVAVIMAVTTIPIAYIAVNFLHMGLEGIIATMTLEILIGAIAMPIQILKFFKKSMG